MACIQRLGVPAEGDWRGTQLLQMPQQIILATWPKHAAVRWKDASLPRDRAARRRVVTYAV